VVQIRIFIDSAKLDEIKLAYDYSLVDGVTTNPSLLKKAVDKLKKEGEDINLKNYIKQILKTAKGTPVSLEVTETDYEGMVKQGKKLYKKFNRVAKNVYIKIPINTSFNERPTADAIKAIKELSRKNIPINCTLIFTPEQALLAAKAGAKIVSPFCGRIDDLIRKENKLKFKKEDYFPAEGIEKRKKILEDNGVVSGIDLVEQIVEMFKNYDIETEVIAASMRNPRQVREAALAGAHIATLPFKVIKQLLSHKKTQEGMRDFTKDIVQEYVDLTK
jgi:transaldolase